ncbi:hypothetical protein [Mobilicoccus pelagius]|uniref:Transmembrane protein n=1 Tax=Mobilicoccus pelagius NBRC 104925 TaxID=1089455 RepID=H5UT15_9MICO|nr:hypothetical protein [Mobilicoccus pelagius]GAB48873.1 hypothetical protein MOPEL_084_00070 [Mobilicoccus pelagius NBRC 104925]
MENHWTSQAYDPAQALADAGTSRQAAADRLVTPPWYHPVLGANLAVLVLAAALPLPTVTLVLVALGSMLVSAALIHRYQRLTGVWIGPAQAGPRSRLLWALYALAIAAAMAVAILVRAQQLPVGWAWVAAAVSAVGTVVLGRRIDATLRDEIRGGRAAAPEARR